LERSSSTSKPDAYSFTGSEKSTSLNLSGSTTHRTRTQSPFGYTGTQQQKIDYCKNHNCSNRGTCHNGENAYTCSCNARYTGRNCENSLQSNSKNAASSYKRVSYCMCWLIAIVQMRLAIHIRGKYI
jgi:hypothetical protein